MLERIAVQKEFGDAGNQLVIEERLHGREEALKLLSQMEQQFRQGRPIRPTSFAIIYAGLNDRDKAFEWLEKAYQQRYEGVIYIKCQPYYDNLRSDPRYYDLVQRIGLTP